jgi:predicted ATPase with chaperone activity
MLSRRLPSIMPPLTPAKSLGITRIYNATDQFKPRRGAAGSAVVPYRTMRSATPGWSAAYPHPLKSAPGAIETNR